MRNIQKNRYRIEFVFEKVAKTILWEYISTFAGLSEWFADQAVSNGKIYTFTWSKSSADAEVKAISQGNYIRFHWIDDENPDSYFELRLQKNELTGDVVLEITDFAESYDKASSVNLWENQVKTLRRVLGL
ncbi:MAG: hypothetical protein LBS54_00835 [Dysgonamonadaceae bacterium]|jgi:uncharacterized protein YndB with AHSA1/START domain|nr:hypothetical protein [Dysgonamonadaceae bacterium]